MNWTRSPLIAAYFAIANLADDVKPFLDGDPAELDKALEGNIAIWALDTCYFKEDYELVRKFTLPPKIAQFLDAQQGLFTYMPRAYLHYAEHGSFPTMDGQMEEICKGKPSKTRPLPRPALIKMVLPKRQALELVRRLWREGVTAAHLMPTFDNIEAAMRVQTVIQSLIARLEAAKASTAAAPSSGSGVK